MVMPMGTGSVRKLYYSIGEVSRITELEPYILRFWETEFPQLKPQKNKAGNRTYRIKDVQLILQIKKLLYEDKFTIQGARKQLKTGIDREITQQKLEFPDKEPIATKPNKLVKTIKKDLQDILSILNK
jgi:DNA-binding transcriptional MerR regulator